jgi:beta-N-acetylhexosaminidase
MAEMTAVAAEAPLLADEAARRAEAALAARRPAAPIDIAATRAEFADLLAGAWTPEWSAPWLPASNSV